MSEKKGMIRRGLSTMKQGSEKGDSANRAGNTTGIMREGSTPANKKPGGLTENMHQ